MSNDSPVMTVTLDKSLVPTPPMGWNSFNCFLRGATESIVMAQADAMVSSGMKDAGYQYVNLDGGWNLLERGPHDELLPDPQKFPRGIKPIADYVHSLGLKFGIYTGVGNTNCAYTTAGSFGHYAQDAELFASYEADYLKFDWCAVPLDDFPGWTPEDVARKLGAEMSQALLATGRPIVFDFNVNPSKRGPGCPENCNVWTWGGEIAHIWRTTWDAHNSYDSLVKNFGRNAQFATFAGPGGWNNPDAFEIGNGKLTTTEAISQFSLWAEMAAPLFAGNDLAGMSQSTRAILTNGAVIEVDQDPLGRQGFPVSSVDGRWVLTKPLVNGDRAVVLFNETDAAATIATTTSAVGMPGGIACSLRDLWSQTTSQTSGTISADVPPHGVVMYRVAAT